MLDVRARLALLFVYVDTLYRRMLNRLLEPVLSDQHHSRTLMQQIAVNVLAALTSVLIATAFIGGVLHFIANVNVSLVYLIAIVLLAIRYGRIAATLGALFAFLADDFFFIQPEHVFTVASLSDVISIILLILVGVITGQLVAELRLRQRTAVESEERMRTLLAFSQDIARTLEDATLVNLLVEDMMKSFEAIGMHVAALMSSTAANGLTLVATCYDHAHVSRDLVLDSALSAEYATRALASGNVETHRLRDAPDGVIAYIPLRSGEKSIGALIAVFSSDAVALLLTMIRPRVYALARVERNRNVPPQGALFAAMCDQITLALDRMHLRAEAIQAEVLRESNRAKDAFLGSITHELQTPIAVILSAITSLQLDDAWDADSRTDLLESARHGALRLKEMVSNTLSFTKLEANAMTLQKTWYPINDVIATAAQQLALAGVTHAGQVHIRIEDDPLEAPMDHALIEQVMINLIENAVRYSPPGKPIDIRADREKDLLVVRVSDHGIGIPSDALRAIFEPFRRLNVPVPGQEFSVPPGSGLGLAICAGIVRAHGGEIHAESQIGQGTTMQFTLPLTAGDPGNLHE